MKKIILLLILLIFTSSTNAEVIKAGISIEDVPEALYGSWRVVAKLDSTNSAKRFKPQSLDFWNLSRVGNVISLDNPFSGAKADVTLQNIEDNIIVFSKKLPYDGNKVLTDTVTIRLNENEFSGINHLKLESFSLIDNSLLKTETATYNIKGEKVSGDSVLKE